MQVAGQTLVKYGYDNADRLTGITQGSQNVVIHYDNANRRSTLTLPNGIKLSYGYDNANEVTGLTYKLSSTTIGNLIYGYNADGEITSRSGTLDVTNLPAALASASYDGNNRLTNWGGQALSYDADGNLTGDGTNTYTWNTRNQLTGISGGSTASFLYDALGRRESKTISSTNTNFLYDGLNLEQELNGTTPTVNYLTGAGIDEVFNRTDSGGAYSYLTDNLGSTLALTNSSGAISTSYSYEPYGNTTASGTSSTNALQYTGRENDGTGLYYYRARYYSSTYGRFISEDPLGLLGGINEYGYASGNPLNLDDPLGLADWAQFQMGGLGQQDVQGLGELVAAQTAQQQLEVAQYNAMQIQFEAAQCISMEFISEFKGEFNNNSNPFQKEFGGVETVVSLKKLVIHVGIAAGLKGAAFTSNTTAEVYSLASDFSGARVLEGVGTAAEWGSGIGEGLIILGTYSDLLDAADTASDMYYFNSSACCKVQ